MQVEVSQGETVELGCVEHRLRGLLMIWTTTRIWVCLANSCRRRPSGFCLGVTGHVANNQVTNQHQTVFL